MEERVRQYVEALFAQAPISQNVMDQKEEMVQNLVDKYHDLRAEGKTPQAAYELVTASVGDISELLGQMETVKKKGEEPRKSVLLVSIAVMLYILCIIPPILLSDAGVVPMFVMVALATGLLIYYQMTKPKQAAEDAARPDEARRQETSGHKAFVSALWGMTALIYVVFSFLTGAWHITWLLFLNAVSVQNLVCAIGDLKRESQTRFKMEDKR